MVDKHLGVQGAKKHDIKVNVLGINHFTWLDKISYKGFDLMPLYEKIANEHSVEGYVRENNAHRKNSVFRCSNAVKFDLYRRFGVAAAAGDRHLAEFMPSSRYLKDLQTIERWGFALTPVDWRIEDRKEVNKKRKRRIDGLDELELHDTGEEGVLQFKAILGLGDYVTNVNMPNVNQLCGITPGAVVETNAYISKDSVQPICSGSLPWDVHNMVSRHSGNQEAVLEAAMTGNKTLAFNAFINDPLVDWIDIGDAKNLFDVMIENTKAYLPDQWGW
jgi:alpha-galactosidase